MWARLLSSTNQPSFLPTKDGDEEVAPTALLDDAIPNDKVMTKDVEH